MAKKRRGINRTEKVREYMSLHPTQSISEVLAGLENQGIKVSRSLVSQVRKRSEMTNAGDSTRSATKNVANRKRSVTAGAGEKVITADDLIEAKKLADELGGLDRVREALDALEKLQ